MSSIAYKVASSSVLRVLSFVAQVIISFLLMPFVVRSLGDRMYGFWTLVGTFIGYYGLLDLGLSSAVSRHVAGAIGASRQDECNRIVNTTLFLYSGLGIVALLVTIVIAILSPVFFSNPEDITLFWKVVLILGIKIAIEFPLRIFSGILVAHIRFDLLAWIEMITLFLNMILTVLALKAGYGVLALAWISLVSSIPGKFLYVYFSKKNFPSLRFSRKDWSRGTARTLFTYSSFTFIAQLAGLLKFQVDHLVITAFIGLATVTHYKVASFMATNFIALVTTVTGVLMPVFSQLDGAKEYNQIKKTFFFGTKISVCVTSFIGYGLIAWGKPFIARWMGTEYLDAYPSLAILVLGCIFALWQTPSVSLLYGISKNRFYAIFNSLEGVCNLLLSLLLVRYWGMEGVALGTFIPMVILKLIIQPIYVCRVTAIQYGAYIRNVARTVGIVCLALIVPLLISIRFAMPNYRVLFIIGMVSFCIYAGILWLFEFNSSEKQVIQAAILPRQFLKKTTT